MRRDGVYCALVFTRVVFFFWILSFVDVPDEFKTSNFRVSWVGPTEVTLKDHFQTFFCDIHIIKFSPRARYR
jgi:hypothetical protein